MSRDECDMADGESNHVLRKKKALPSQCVWCSEPLGEESFTVTYPDKDQAVFHIHCLYHYRELMQPY